MDTIQVVYDTVYVVNESLLETVSRVDGFYKNAWDTLSITIMIMLTLVGIVLPILLNIKNWGDIKKAEKSILELTKLYKKQESVTADIIKTQMKIRSVQNKLSDEDKHTWRQDLVSMGMSESEIQHFLNTLENPSD